MLRSRQGEKRSPNRSNGGYYCLHENILAAWDTAHFAGAGHGARGLQHKQERIWSVASVQNASVESGTARQVVSANGAGRVGTTEGSMRSLMFEGTAGCVTRLFGGVGGRGREASSYPD